MKKTDFRNFTWDKLNTEEYSHLKLLLYWPVYGLLFYFVERVYAPGGYIVMHCALDDAIPFCEYFLIAYLFWFVYLIGALAYTLFLDREGFRRMMRFIIFTYSVTILIYILFPTCQHLRPSELARDNALTRFAAYFYRFDTDTNVCPSLHVIGSFAACFTLWDTGRFSSRGWRAANAACCALICASTVFMKQHSVLDVAAALPLCLAGYALCYMKNPPRRVKITSSAKVKGGGI